MKKFKKPSAEKAYQYFLDTPGAKVSGVAKRFKLSVPYVYKLREKAAGKGEPLLSPAELEALSVPPTHKQESMTTTIENRGSIYGAFSDNARLAQALKRAMADHASDHDRTFADDQWEALEMIASKMSRIVNGNPDGIDNWHDIAGYATLIADRLRGVSR